MNNYTVYAHINKENKKVYIGMTCRKPEKRWKNGAGYHSESFSEDIKKYGWDGFEHVIIKDNLTKDEACLMERKLIDIFEATNPDCGYNKYDGGMPGGMTGKHQSEDAKKRISETMKKRDFSEEHRKKISIAKRGLNHHFAKKVYQYSKDGEFIREWDYMNLAAQTLKISKANIAETCHGNRPSAGGYVWRYERM